MLSLQHVFADSTGAVGEVHCGRIDVRPDGLDAAPIRDPGGTSSIARPAERRTRARADARRRSASSLRTIGRRGERGKRWVDAARAERSLRAHHAAARRRPRSRRHGPRLVRRVRRLRGAPPRGVGAALARRSPRRARSSPGARSSAIARSSASSTRLHGEVTRGLLERSIGAQRAARASSTISAQRCSSSTTLDRVLALEVPTLLDARRSSRRACSRVRGRARRSGTARHALPIVRRFADPVTQGKLGSALGMCSAPVTFPGAPVRAVPDARGSLRGRVTRLRSCVPLRDRPRRTRGGWYHVPGGASERRTGPGYGKGVDLWAEGRFLPLGPVSGEPASRALKAQRRRASACGCREAARRGRARARRAARDGASRSGSAPATRKSPEPRRPSKISFAPPVQREEPARERRARGRRYFGAATSASFGIGPIVAITSTGRMLSPVLVLPGAAQHLAGGERRRCRTWRRRRLRRRPPRRRRRCASGRRARARRSGGRRSPAPRGACAGRDSRPRCHAAPTPRAARGARRASSVRRDAR